MNPKQKFWKNVDKKSPSECWEWQAGKNGQGYGYLWNGCKQIGTHRFSWELHNGPISDGLHVLHTCDNPACVNPAHLWLGTIADNNADRDRKGRWGGGGPKGENSGRTKLTNENVLQIRDDHKNGIARKDLAKQHGVHHSTIDYIVNRKTWTHI